MVVRSLKDFAGATPNYGGKVAWITTIPEYEECLEAYKSGGVQICQIRDWLIVEKGYLPGVATRARIENLRIGAARA